MKPILLSFFILMLVGCSESSETFQLEESQNEHINEHINEATYAVALQSAVSSMKAASDMNNLWITSGALLKKAEARFAAGDITQAIDLVNEAKLHGDLALLQAEAEEKSWHGKAL